MKLEFTNDEINGLFALLNAGLKADGDAAAETYVYFKRKFTEAAKAEADAKAASDKETK
jgi:hypothetical protein